MEKGSLEDLLMRNRNSVPAFLQGGDTRTFMDRDPNAALMQRQVGSGPIGLLAPNNPYRAEAEQAVVNNVAQAMSDPMMGISGKVPKWWREGSTNPFAKGMTQGDEIMDFLTRHNVPSEADKYVFYHATPKTNNLSELRQGSHLAYQPEQALHQAGRDRSLTPEDLSLYKVLVDPWQIETGVWPALREAYKLTD